MRQITVIQRVLPHYRIPFFIELEKVLQRDGIALNLVYGQEYPGTVPRTTVCNESWAHRVENRYLKVAGKELVWQPCLNRAINSDLIIVEQSSRLLLNYLLLLGLTRRHSKLAFWGHGRNFQAGMRPSWHERIKRSLVGKADWWFAYTALSASYIARSGFPPEKITLVQNAIDTRELKLNLDHCCSSGDLDVFRAAMGIKSKSIGLYCGGMYEYKKLEFLLRSAVKIREQVSDFHLILVGDGPDHEIAASAAEKYEWIHYEGPKFGRSLAPYYKVSKVFLMPGLVGLGILDSFVAGIPLFTTDIPIHSPEIAYLENGINGVMTSHSADSYADAVAAYLRDESAQKRLREGCEKSAKLYSVEAMAKNFSKGIKCCLGS